MGDDTVEDLIGLGAAENLTKAMQAFARTVSDTGERLIQVGKQFLKANEKAFGNSPAYSAAITRDGTVIHGRGFGKSAAVLHSGERIITAADLRATTPPPPLPSGLKHPTARPPTTLEDAVCCTFHAGGVVLRDQPPLAIRSHPHASQGKGRLNRR